MIFTEIAAAKTMNLEGWLCELDASVIQLPVDPAEDGFCVCEWMCDYTEDAFVYPTDENNQFRNDFKSLLSVRWDAAGAYEFRVISNGVTTVLLDGVHGTLYPPGFNLEQPLLVGFKIDWVKIYNTIGPGIYQIERMVTNFGYEHLRLSHQYNVRLWSDLISNFTVRIQTVKEGFILNGEYHNNDFTGLMLWIDMVRIRGTFGAMAPQYEIDRLVDSSRRDIDVQTTKYNNYTLFTELLPEEIGNVLTDEIVLSDKIFITVNDLFNYSQYEGLGVTFEGSIEAGEDYGMNNRKKFNITFKDNTSKVKRNFV